MIKPINPWNVLAFYNGNTSLATEGHLLAPTNGLLPFQLFLPNEDLTSVRAIELVTGGTTTLDVGAVEIEQITSGYFFTYKGALWALPAGIYQLELVSNGIAYFSHVICCVNIFTAADAFEGNFSLGIDSCALSIAGDFFITLEVQGAENGTVGVTLIPTGLAPVSLPFPYSFNQSMWGGASGTLTAAIIATITIADGNGGSITATGVYSFSVNTDGDPCDSALISGGSFTTEQGAEGTVLVFGDDSDRKGQRLLYSTGYEQKFYFKGYKEMPVPVTEETFLVNGDVEVLLSTVKMYEQHVFEFWPMPDYLLAVLKNARYHNNKKIIQGSAETELRSLDCEAKQIGDAPIRAGVLRCDVNAAWANACEDNYELE